MQTSVTRFFSNRANWLLLLVLWASAVGLSLQSQISDIRRHNQEVVTEGARNMFRMVLLTRLWNSEHGGVYVPVDEKTRPNPYLKHPKRDITDNFGRSLTMVNPAYMTRLISELAKQDEGLVFRITSLLPVNPQNAADSWEHQALESFERGVKEISGFEVSERDGLLHRYMAPLVVVDACLKCHAAQGYRIGDIRGGISVSQRYEPFLAAAQPSERQAYFTHAVIFLLMLGVAWWLLEQLRGRWRELGDKIIEVEAARDELVQSEKMASLGRMVAGFAHEINTPIGVAVGAITNSEHTLDQINRLLDSEEVSEDDLRAALATLKQGDELAMSNLRRAAGLVQSFKRTSIDQASDHERVFALRELIDDVLHGLQNQLKRLPVIVTVNCPESLKIEGAPGLLEQLLTNMVLNSIIHGFDHGARSGEISIKAASGNQKLSIEYADTGAGMNPETLARLFEPFFTTRRGEGGSGLGMYICYNIVTVNLGGSLSCQSTPGEGVKFLIDFPAKVIVK
jgi:signal transduction histidine kinase